MKRKAAVKEPETLTLLPVNPPPAETLAAAEPAPLIPAPEAVLDLTQMSDTDLIDYIAAYEEELLHVKDIITPRISEGKFEVERRIRERAKASGGVARAIPHPKYDSIELEPEYTAYQPNFDLLEKAKKLLKADEAGKVCRLIPEETKVIPAHYEAGPAVSIVALAKKYAGSDAGNLLTAGFTRTKTGDRLVMKKIKLALPKGGTA